MVMMMMMDFHCNPYQVDILLQVCFIFIVVIVFFCFDFFCFVFFFFFFFFVNLKKPKKAHSAVIGSNTVRRYFCTSYLRCTYPVCKRTVGKGYK